VDAGFLGGESDGCWVIERRSFEETVGYVFGDGGREEDWCLRDDGHHAAERDDVTVED